MRCSCGYLAYDENDLIEHQGLYEHLEAENELLRAEVRGLHAAGAIAPGLECACEWCK